MNLRSSDFPSLPELEGRALQGAVMPQYLWEAGHSVSWYPWLWVPDAWGDIAVGLSGKGSIA